MKLAICFIYLLFVSKSLVNSFGNDTLRSVHVIFRHGDRTPEAFPTGFYPTDPHKLRSFDPMGYGGLLNEGKRREYNLGHMLRNQYDSFLGDYYKASDVFAVSTSPERTRMSLLLVLAGLYPPQDKQVWKEGLDWQPIPMNSIPIDAQAYLYPSACPAYTQEMERVLESSEYRAEIAEFLPLMERLSNLTGTNINNTHQVAHLYHTLTSERTMDLSLPEWTKEYFPFGLVKKAILFQYKTESYNNKLKKLAGGATIRKVLDGISFDRHKKTYKMNLYSAHEINIASTLFALNLWKDVIPEYSSGVVFEFHEIHSTLFIRILYYKGIPAEFERQVIPGCSEFCPLEDFLKIFKDIIPDDIIESCFGPPEDSQLIPTNINPISWIYKKLREWFKT